MKILLTPKEFEDIVIKALQAEFNGGNRHVTGYQTIGTEEIPIEMVSPIESVYVLLENDNANTKQTPNS